MRKQECRDLYKLKRLQLSEEHLALMNRELLLQLQSFDWKPYNRVHVFLSMSKFKEPDTSAFIRWIQASHPSMQLVLSKTDFKHGTMDNYLYNENTILDVNAWGILEPTDGIKIEDNSIDAVIVPMLVCDEHGNRVGFGKGFYDRFLNNCKESVVAIGLSFFEPITQIIDVEPWDYPIHYCVTPNKILKFTK